MVGEHLFLMDFFLGEIGILIFSLTIKLCEMFIFFCMVSKYMKIYGRRVHNGWKIA
jgi:hypothetical protein